MKDFIFKTIIYTILSGVFALFILAIITPDKTNSGKYTNFWKYWTDDIYFTENFTNTNN